jgi:hypothetical protein
MNKLITVVLAFVVAAAMVTNTFAAEASMDKVLDKEEPGMAVKTDLHLHGQGGWSDDYASSSSSSKWKSGGKYKSGGEYKSGGKYKYKSGGRSSSSSGDW